MDSSRTPWIINIETRLRQRGFKVLRAASQHKVMDQVSNTRTEIYNEASARYVLYVEGEDDPARRCFGGGFTFSYLTAELIDIKTNETIFSTSGSGYSEGCPPMSGHIFGDIVEGVVSSWK